MLTWLINRLTTFKENMYIRGARKLRARIIHAREAGKEDKALDLERRLEGLEFMRKQDLQNKKQMDDFYKEKGFRPDE